LRHFIIPQEDGTIELQNTPDLYTIQDAPQYEKDIASTYYYLSTAAGKGDDISLAGEKAPERRVLTRISAPTCAIFHKSGGGQGVPHTFVGKMYSRVMHGLD
jgi:hypothetical protein